MQAPPHTLPVSFSALGLVIKLKATVQPIPNSVGCWQSRVPPWPGPSHCAVVLPSAPMKATPNPCLPSPSANRVRRIKSGTCGSIVWVGRLPQKSPPGFDGPISQSAFQTTLKNVLRPQPNLNLEPRLAPEHGARPHYLPSRTQTRSPFIDRLCPTPASRSQWSAEWIVPFSFSFSLGKARSSRS